MSVLSQLASDNFPYANGDLNASNPNWVYAVGNFAVANNVVFANANPALAFRSDVVWPNNQYSQTKIKVLIAAGAQPSGPAVRVSNSANTGYVIRATSGPSAIALIRIINGVTIQIALASSPSLSDGDVIQLQVIGNSLTAFQNGVAIPGITGIIDNSISSGNAGINGAGSNGQKLIGFGSWSAGSILNVYSVPDCRNYATFPNTGRNVQNTLIYDVQTSSNHAIPPTDSRVAGAPVDGRISPNIPQNSRTSGTYGPGE